MIKTRLFVLFFCLIFSTSLFAQNDSQKTPETAKKGRNPIIVIPGIMGSKLVNKLNGKEVWVKFDDAKEDDLALPFSPNLSSNRDNIVASDIVDKVKIVRFLPGVSVYNPLLEYLEKEAKYTRGNWDRPFSTSDQDTYYVFAYDWRRDNVESARLLLQKIQKLKLKLKKPNLKFDVLAHSMGGLIARYAAMYGSADLQATPKPTWAGAKHFNRIFTLGTPNEGAMNALEAFYTGYTIDTLVGRYSIKSLDREAIFTSPAAYQLLPHGKFAKFYDEDLKPLPMDIYNPATWKKYGWTIFDDEKIMAKFSPAKKTQAERYFAAVLMRAKKFHEALDAKSEIPNSLGLYAFGSDCKDTLDGAIVYFDAEKKKWRTILRSESFKNSKGEKVDEKLVKQTIFVGGDGTVPKRSFLGENISALNSRVLHSVDSLLPEPLIVCDSHTSIPNNKKVQEFFNTFLISAPVTK